MNDQSVLKHIPVLMSEVLEILDPKPGFAYIDGTLGMGGHSKAIMQKTNGQAHIIGFDRDSKSLELAKQNLAEYQNIQFIHGRFSQIPELVEQKLTKPVRGVLLDLGISSFQLDTKEYGLTFAKEAFEQNLDMRLDEWCQESAADILNEWPQQKLADLFWDLADYRYARKLAKLILENRPLKTIGQFVGLCNIASGNNKAKISAATLPLMALRIAVNQEYEELVISLQKLIDWLEPGAILAVISFHSGEDRIVKNIFKNTKQMSSFTKKPITPSPSEVKHNIRSRSAKLRAACKISSIENINN
jgi:16S rRNA (cytosine1402-N4)-methyltransferase